MQGFETLMPYRIQEVVLVSSLYDAFILQEDGQLEDLLHGGRAVFGARGPKMVRVSNASEALDRVMHSDKNELVIVTPQMGGINPVSFAEQVKQHTGSTPVVLLGYDTGAIDSLMRDGGVNAFDEVFLWTGDSRILNSIVTLMEDRRNCVHDCEVVGVRSIMLVEDSLNFLSAYLPRLYAEIQQQIRSVLEESVNTSHKFQRARARPKILLARDLRSAVQVFENHKEHLLGVITDITLPETRHRTKMDEQAGRKLLEHMRREAPHLPVMVQSSDPANVDLAYEFNSTFTQKGSNLLHQQMREFLLENFGFGPFQFKGTDGKLITQARSLRELEAALREVDLESIMQHAKGNHFSTWLRARTEFALADQLSDKEVGDFADIEDIRGYLVNTLYQARKASLRGAIADFDRNSFDDTVNFARIGNGSLGGKARGLAFINRTMPHYVPDSEFQGVRIHVPQVVVLTTEIFDRFLRRNHLHKVAFSDELNEEERQARFLRGRLPGGLLSDLRALLRHFHGPLAVRSSSLLEDSHHQPFAGIYETVMIRNAGSLEKRLTELCRGIKRIYASAFSDRARSYIRATPYRHEEEKMAVIIQPVYGKNRNGRFYPSFSGVARSHNFYPHGRCKPEDGVCSVALGLGRTVVAGEGGLRFCPEYPMSLPEFSSVEDILENAQRYFYAIPMDPDASDEADNIERFQPCRFPVSTADQDDALHPMASTWIPADGRIADGVGRPGTRLVTFASILKHQTFPLAQFASSLLEIGGRSMGCPVELEFAVNLDPADGLGAEIALLQIRPMAVSEASVDFSMDEVDDERIVCASHRAFGNGRIRGIQDIVFVDPQDFDRAVSRETAADIAQWNAVLSNQGRPYLLIGPGRWGSKDSWMGIPVDWAEINGARVVVETGFKQFRVQPSEGSHFFHNLTSFRVGYFSVNPQADEGHLDLEWLRSWPVVESGANGLAHIQLDKELEVWIDGSEAHGVILRPD